MRAQSTQVRSSATGATLGSSRKATRRTARARAVSHSSRRLSSGVIVTGGDVSTGPESRPSRFGPALEGMLQLAFWPEGQRARRRKSPLLRALLLLTTLALLSACTPAPRPVDLLEAPAAMVEGRITGGRE